jgi:hypothetical protein
VSGLYILLFIMSFSSKSGQATEKTLPTYKLMMILKASANHQYRVMMDICLRNRLNSARKLNLTEHIAPYRGINVAAESFL